MSSNKLYRIITTSPPYFPDEPVMGAKGITNVLLEIKTNFTSSGLGGQCKRAPQFKEQQQLDKQDGVFQWHLSWDKEPARVTTTRWYRPEIQHQSVLLLCNKQQEILLLAMWTSFVANAILKTHLPADSEQTTRGDCVKRMPDVEGVLRGNDKENKIIL